MRIAVIGGSAGGPSAALLLARAGHAVTVLEADRLEPAADVEAAAVAGRCAARLRRRSSQPHVLLTAFQEIVLEHLPDVYTRLRNAEPPRRRWRARCPRRWPTVLSHQPPSGCCCF